MRVDLPEPEGPMTATNSPGSMVKLTPRNACTAISSANRYVLVRSIVWITTILRLPET